MITKWGLKSKWDEPHELHRIDDSSLELTAAKQSANANGSGHRPAKPVLAFSAVEIVGGDRHPLGDRLRLGSPPPFLARLSTLAFFI